MVPWIVLDPGRYLSFFPIEDSSWMFTSEFCFCFSTSLYPIVPVCWLSPFRLLYSKRSSVHLFTISMFECYRELPEVLICLLFYFVEYIKHSSRSLPQVKKLPYKVMTGYTLYSSEIRKDIATKHPEASFGEISRLVGAEVSTWNPACRIYLLFENTCIPSSKEINVLS